MGFAVIMIGVWHSMAGFFFYIIMADTEDSKQSVITFRHNGIRRGILYFGCVFNK